MGFYDDENAIIRRPGLYGYTYMLLYSTCTNFKQEKQKIVLPQVTEEENRYT